MRVNILYVLVSFCFVYVYDCSFSINILRQNIFLDRGAAQTGQSMILEPFWDFGGSRNRPSEHHLRPKNLKKPATPNSRERLGADLGVIRRRKRSKDAFSLILVSFLIDVERILDQFGWICS